MSNDNGRDDDAESASAASADLIAIQRAAARYSEKDRFWKAARAKRPDLDRAIRLQHEIELLAEAWLAEGRKLRRGLDFRVRRIMVTRFGKLGTRHILNLLADVSPLSLRLELRKRDDHELSDGGRSKNEIEQELEDAEFAIKVQRKLKAGMRAKDAITQVLEETDQIMLGVAGAKKVLARARRAARARGYIDPREAFVAWIAGGFTIEPDLKIADIPRRGRPRKNCDG